MNIQILDSWLREYLETNAKATDIASCMSLCGPTFEKTLNSGNDYLYDIEVTTNRVDLMSVVGLAKEAQAILPRFNYTAKLKKVSLANPKTPKESLPLGIKTNPGLTGRATGVVLTDLKNTNTPDWMKTRLEAAGIRSKSAPVDITNYVMLELGHPMHVFDYDKINTKKFIIRESEKGEKIVALDEKAYELPGGDIVIDDSTGQIIDLPGIIGTKNSVVDANTKRFLLFIDNNNPVNIRKTSMTLGIRTPAATLNEKGVDPELAMTVMLRGIRLFEEVCGAKVASRIYDVYPQKPKIETVHLNKLFIDKILGISVSKNEILGMLKSLGFRVQWNNEELQVTPPSFRAKDIKIPEDVVEEIARIYGYHNFPSKLMATGLPEPYQSASFNFEAEIKSLLQGWGGVEVYTYSLVSKNEAGGKALGLKNPLGVESAYLRTTLMPSLIRASKENKGEKEPFHLFEIANVYLQFKRSTSRLPQEIMTLAGVFSNYSYRNAKGVMEALLNKLKINFSESTQDGKNFLPSQRVVFATGKEALGTFGVTEFDKLIYYEFEIEKLKKAHVPTPTYKPIPKYPPQIEDISFTLPEKTRISDVISSISSVDKLVQSVELMNIYEDSYTLRIHYQDSTKTLTNEEVEIIRKRILTKLKIKYGISLKG